ncbi:F-box/RNI-like superfamily protein [Thalictrum thalictroides]|uniref:F-box/RNI-like superfamily protein n=1 Tax=Thalictrum thalictroides TaxID=46969 RepID=A0A7J6VS81_THATH|nr:F-box/RNI-like superfamily protein [Thalictrum thalictroides]
MAKRHCSAENSLDRLSDLPPSIQSHIVSFLPLMDAVRTSILSRRWKDICRSLSKLDFGGFSFLQKMSTEDVKDVINQMLVLHDGSDVQYPKLDIEFDGEYICLHHVNRWISFTISHNVLDLFLHLNLITHIHVKLPCFSFTSNTLSELGLFDFDLILPTIIHFPVLKTLSFGYITFSDEFQTSKLFSDSCCPMLETLEIKNCKFDHFTTISISATNLKFVKQKDTHHGFKFNLSNPNLREICFKGSKLPEISFKALSSLFIATFELVLRPSSSDVMENLVSKLLMGLHNVGTLRLKRLRN